MECNWLKPDTCVAQAAQDAMTALAHSYAAAASWTVSHLMPLWLNVPSPDVTSSSSPAVWLADRLHVLVLAVAFLSVLYGAYLMATSGRFRDAAELGLSLGRLILVAGCVGVATSLALDVGDAVAAWVLQDAPLHISALLVNPLTAAGTPAGIVLLLALVVILTQLVQLALMLIKNAMVVLLVGFLPLAAAATNTGVGKNGYQKALTWLAAFVLYKPICAAIYAVSFRLASADQSASGQLSGIALMVLAVVALPALMRFLAPATASATGGNAGAIAAATEGAVLATGAMVATGGFSGVGGFAAAGSAPTGAASGAVSAVDSTPESRPSGKAATNDN